MRAFHELVFDERIEDAAFHAPPWPWGLLFGSVDTLKLVVAVDSVEGVSPTLSMILYDLPNLVQTEWVKVPFTDTPLLLTQNTLLTATYSAADALYPASNALHFVVWLGGASPKAHVRVWVTGRQN